MMMLLVSSLIDFLARNPGVAYLAVFVLALSESIPIVGAIVPGSAIIVALSALVPGGVLMLWPLLVGATIGAIAGDGLSFWLGHKYHRAILGFWPLYRYPELIERSEAFVQRHGNKSVFLARFTPGIRAFVPLLAGSLAMSTGRFYAVNIASALIWAPSHILPGVLAGAAFSNLGTAAKPLAILLVVVIAVSWLFLHLVRYVFRRGLPLLATGAERLRTWAGAREGRMRRLLADLLDPDRHEARAIAILIAFLIGSAWIFFGILEDVVSGDSLVLADGAIHRALQDIRTAHGDAVMIAITELGDTTVVLAMTLVVLLWLMWMRAWRTAAYWVVAIAGASALNTAIKVALHRERPGELLYSGWSAFSFPSGHSTVNLVLYGFLAFLLTRGLRRPTWRLPVALAAGTLVILIAFSRLYLGAHWLSDVVGGMAFGSAWLALLVMSYMRRQGEDIGAAWLLALTCAALVIVGGAHIHRNHAADNQRYAVKDVLETISAEGWWTSGWQRLPARRIDLTGETEEPLTLQWVGEVQQIEDLLQKDGWRVAAPWSPLSAMVWFTAQPDPYDLPVVPSFAGGRLPVLILVKSVDTASPGGARLVLQLWATDHKVTNGRTAPLWIGSVVAEHLDHPIAGFTMVSRQPDADAPRQALRAALAGVHTDFRQMARPGKHWDGRVLIAGASGAQNSQSQP